MDASPLSTVAHSSPSDCVNLGPSASLSFPFYHGWKLDFGSNLKPKELAFIFGAGTSAFPTVFIFCARTSAYQVERAADEDGRTPSIWDTYAHAGYARGYTTDIACDQYHKYKEDVKLMADMSLDAYRFFISQSRLIPRIHPHVTLVDFDHPKALEY